MLTPTRFIVHFLVNPQLYIGITFTPMLKKKKKKKRRTIIIYLWWVKFCDGFIFSNGLGIGAFYRFWRKIMI